MKIAAWNIERLKHNPDKLKAAIDEIGADILVLTEYDERLKLDYKYSFCTPTPPDIDGTRFGTIHYNSTEHRVCVFTDYRCICRYEVADMYSSVCVKLETERGNLLVYGTIIGTHDVTTTFPIDLKRQFPDFARFSGNDLCVCGDLNCCFTGRCFPSKYGRDTLLKSFSENHIRLLTKEQPECIDHIAVSESFVDNSNIKIEEWNIDKKLSDHKGTAIVI